MGSDIQMHSDHVEIRLSGDLTFSGYRQFQELMKSAASAGKNACIIDLSSVDTIDSAGIGMLLFANDETSETSMRLRLRNPQGAVKAVLEHTRVDKVIPIVA